jgi:transcriptional regulator with XRE-family HTH domain
VTAIRLRPRKPQAERDAWALFCRGARARLGLSVREMATALGIEGHTKYSEWERGSNLPRDRAGVEDAILGLLAARRDRDRHS